MSNLPEIPNEVFAAFESYLAGVCAPIHLGGLERAWPALYAVALRHAADRVMSDDDEPDKHDWTAREIANDLRGWADEASA